MNLLRLSCSSEGETLSIRIVLQGDPFVLHIGHPLLAIFGKISCDSTKGLELLEPIQVVDEGSSVPEKTVEWELLKEVEKGFLSHLPELCEEGVNGTYFLKNEDGEIIAVFKPNDEEGKGSPKRSEEGEVVNTGILDGEGALREIAAYLLDKDHFSGVPETRMVSFANNEHFRGASGEAVTKTGSLQRFIENDGASWDVGPGVFPVHEVHKIGVLDLRIFNNDRHGGNILYKEMEDGTYRLIPIDHGLSLPSNLERSWFDWISWPQAKQPFDQQTLRYIEEIDIEEDAQTLENLGIRPECIRTMRISTTLLKKGAAAGLSLYQIGNMAARTVLEEPSQLEKMFEKAQEQTLEEKQMLENLWRIMDDEIIMLGM